MQHFNYGWVFDVYIQGVSWAIGNLIVDCGRWWWWWLKCALIKEREREGRVYIFKSGTWPCKSFLL